MATVDYIYTTQVGERLDQICVKRYGSSANDVVVYVLNQNHRSRLQGIILELGTVIISLPDLPATAATSTVRSQVLLWDDRCLQATPLHSKSGRWWKTSRRTSSTVRLISRSAFSSGNGNAEQLQHYRRRPRLACLVSARR